MTVPDEIAKIEMDGIQRTKVNDYRGAREYFEQALTFEMPAFRKANIVKNIAGTYFKEGNHEGVVQTVERAIAILDSEGVSAEQLGNELRNLSIYSAVNVKQPLSAFFAAYCNGAALGAYLGSKAHGAGYTIWGLPIDQDLRYGGAAFGAFLGLFFFSRAALAAGPALSWLSGIVCAILTTNILLEENVKVGLLVLGNLVLVPVLIGSILSARFRNK